MTTCSSILAWKIPWTGCLVGHSPWGSKELDTTELLSMHARRGDPRGSVLKAGEHD